MKPRKTDNFYANTALILSLGFWIPLLNIGLTATSLYLSSRALKLIDSDPKSYGGRSQAIIAIIISVTTLILAFLGVTFYFLTNLGAAK